MRPTLRFAPAYCYCAGKGCLPVPHCRSGPSGNAAEAIMSKKESPRLVLLPTFPTAAVVVAATTAGAAAVVATLTAGGGAASWAAVATAAATTAIVTALVWPRVATDVLGLHGTSFPSPADGGDMPLLGRVPQLVTAARGKTLVHTYLDWQRRVGWGVNHQFYTLGRRAVVIVDPDDIRAVAMRLNAPRDQRKLRFFGTPLSADMLFVVPDPRHDNARRLVHPFLSGTPTTETVLRVVNETLWGVPSRSVGSDGARSGGGAAPPARWAAHLEALADSGESVDIDDLATSFTVHMIYALLYSETPSLSELADEKDRLIRLIADTTALVGLPAPELLGRARMTSLRKAGDKFFIEFERRAAARRAAYVTGATAAQPPRDMLDVMLADLDKGKTGAYQGDRRRVAADMLFYVLAGYDTTVRCSGGVDGTAVLS